jgi:hypothetical protein
MSNKAKLRPGEVWIIVGMLPLLAGAIWLPILLFDKMPAYSALTAKGHTVEGVVWSKEVETTTNSRRRRNSSSENYYLVIAFDPGRGVPYGSQDDPVDAPPHAAPKSGKDIVDGLFRSAKPGVGGDARIRVNAGSHERFEAHSIGDAISVTFLPGDPDSAKLTERVRSFNPWPQVLGAVALLLGGIVASWFGFRRRRQAVRAQAAAG